ALHGVREHTTDRMGKALRRRAHRRTGRRAQGASEGAVVDRTRAVRRFQLEVIDGNLSRTERPCQFEEPLTWTAFRSSTSRLNIVRSPTRSRSGSNASSNVLRSSWARRWTDSSANSPSSPVYRIASESEAERTR